VGIWWTGSRLDQLASHLPSVGTPIHGSSIVKYRYYFNTVTFSYTTVFWPFEETQDSGSDNWSYLLDWLALHGINLPLAWNGHEFILSEVYRDAGLSDADIRSYLSGPAFLSWNRLGNIQGSWGPSPELPERWITDQFTLQKKIVERMTSLGMTPALSSFTGFVPNALHEHYPTADIITESQWDNFPVSLTNVSFLNPVDKLFETLQASYLKKQQEAYGPDVSHIYALDQYNENMPLVDTLDYLHNVSSNTMSSIRAADPEGIWLMQAWLFFSDAVFWTQDRINAYLGGIPNDSVLILDLYTEAQPVWSVSNS
jgi:alpha-N-acetylglucosaminidase